MSHFIDAHCKPRAAMETRPRRGNRLRRLAALLSMSLAGLFPLSMAAFNEPREQTVEAPLEPEEAARAMVVPEGFQVTLFAGEPDVRQPIGFCIDDRGRLWVAEAYNYPHHGTAPGDRIVIFEDTDGDGRFDRRKVFFDRLNYVTGIEVGFGGAWVVSPPFFYFIADRDGDDQPDGDPEVLLDGLGNHANAHNLANALSWGPDGWLYGTHGRTNWSLIGRPGTPEQLRVRFDGGVYRYHPVKRIWEAYADGTTNPWGIDWNERGDAFVTNCVNPHLFHIVQGAHYEPWRNRDSSRYAYERLPTIADHLHYVGQGNVRAGLNSPAEDDVGGGHAHCGVMIYQGDNWPETYRGGLFTNNIHGHRINNDQLRRVGSGYSASHSRDILRSRDLWFMGVTLQYGPDGSVFVIDWSDTGECHSYTNTRRETGRIYKVSYRDGVQREPVDLASLSDDQLVELHGHRNEWFVRHARRLLQERSAAGRDLSNVARRLGGELDSAPTMAQRLRALWTLHATGQLDDVFLRRLLDDADEAIRAWAVKLLFDFGRPSDESLSRMINLAARDPSAYVRLSLASGLQRLALHDRWMLAAALLSHAEDANDPNLPLMYWYGVEPLIDADMDQFVDLAQNSRVPLVTRFIARRAASHGASTLGVATIVKAVARSEEPTQQSLLSGLVEGLKGRRSAPMPDAWPTAYNALQKSQTRSLVELSLRLGLIFDDPAAIAAIRRIAVDKGESSDSRGRAISALAAKRTADLAPLLLDLIADPTVGQFATKALAEYDHPDTAKRLIGVYSQLSPMARVDAIQTLASKASWATALLEAIESGEIPSGDLSAFSARQIQSLGDDQLTKQLASVWGSVRTTVAEKSGQIQQYRRQLTPELLRQSDRSAGRTLFQKLCAHCHRLFDDGGAIGPNITGSQRTNLEYMLSTIVDPSAAVARDYQMQIIVTDSGRVLTGLVVDESDSAVVVQSVNERIVVPKVEIESRQNSSLSMMPEGMLQSLTTEQLRQLFAYLMGPDQAPLPADIRMFSDMR